MSFSHDTGEPLYFALHTNTGSELHRSVPLTPADTTCIQACSEAGTIASTSSEHSTAFPVSLVCDARLQGFITPQAMVPAPCTSEHDCSNTILRDIARLSDVLRDISSPTHDSFMEFTGLTQQEFEVLTRHLEEPDTGEPRVTYRSDKLILVEWPSAAHEAPMHALRDAITSMFPPPYPVQFVELSVAPQYRIRSAKLTAVPDMVVAMTSRRPTKARLPFIAECAFSQTRDSVFTKLRTEIAAHPEVVMVLIFMVHEEHDAPPEVHSGAWEKFRGDASPLSLEAFIAACDDMEDVFEGSVTAADHTWCDISSVDYYVWLRKEAAVPINIDDEDEYYAHGTMPGNVHMDRVKALLNRGFELIKNSLASFCKEIDPDADCTLLEQSNVALPAKWGYFLRSLASAAEKTAYDRYIAWYQDSFMTESDEEYTKPEGISSSEFSSAPAQEMLPRTRAGTRQLINGAGST
ncbi:hypothetical protein PAXINDRAFT_9234 [Paxillus involutus ATCC 200175]|nr:hypothetical protein PAXINDRAFT_9234 [Paxillus involutus ATCC 200175]